MKIRNILLVVVTTFTLFGCGGSGDYTPKPQAYLRIELPEHEYFLLDTMRTNPGDTLVFDGDTAIILTGSSTTFPFVFEANTCIEWTESSLTSGARFIQIAKLGCILIYNGCVFICKV